MMFRSLLLCFCLVTSVVYGRADFLILSESLGSSAKMIGLGHTEGFSSHSNVIFENPAGLAYQGKGSGHVFTTQRLDDVRFYEFSGAYAYRGLVFGLGLYTASVQGIYETQRSGDIISIKDVIGYRSDQFKLGAAYPLEKYKSDIGASFSYFRSELGDTTGRGGNMDIGVLTRWFSPVELSITVRNLLMFQNVKYSNGGAENLASSLVVGGRVPYHFLTVYGQLRKTQHQEPLFMTLGSEFTVVPGWFSFYGGYRTFYNTAFQSRSSVAMGFELTVNRLAFQYAFASGERQDSVLNHHFSIGYQL